VGVVYPTVGLGVSTLGIEVVDRLTASLDSTEPLLSVLRCEHAQQVGEQLGSALQSLLEAGRNAAHLSEPRLDIFAFADGWSQSSDELIMLCQQASAVIGDRFGALFPANRPPRQRTASLHLVLIVPPLTGADAMGMLRRLRKLERWAEEGHAPYPLLSRIWLLSTHTQAGVLSKADTVASAAAFGISMIGSGLREEDVIAARMGHHETKEGLFAFFSAASLDLPKARLRAYAAERAVYDATAALVARVEQEADPSVAINTITPLRHEQWLEPFTSGEPARRCRQLAANLSGATASLPDRITVHPFDEAEDIRSSYAILFREATRVRETTHADASSLDEMILALDKSESASFRLMRDGMHRIFSVTLGPKSGLRELPMVEAGLRRLLAQLQDADAREETNPAEGPSDADPLRTELESALALLPSRAMLAAVAGTAGVTVGLLFLFVTLGISATELQMDVNYHPTAVLRTRVAIWFFSAVAALISGYLAARWIGARSRAAITEALTRRRDAIYDLWRMGGGGQPGRQAEAQLRQRRLRVRRGAIRLIEGNLEHLQAVRRSLLEARDQAHRRLSDLCSAPQPDPALDDLEPLLGPPRPLHAPLVSPSVANWWVRSCRDIVDGEVWANRLLEGSWPREGLAVDLPCADEVQLKELGRRQTRPLTERNLFGDPQGAEAAAETVAEFTDRAPRALAPPTAPRDTHGDPVMGIRHGDMFAVAPVEARANLRSIFEEAPLSLPALWTSARAERVLFVRTWEGFTVAQLARAASINREK
jgi:hypothetical protein